jgi:hypothetical protein
MMGSCYVTQAGLKLVCSNDPPLKCGDYMCAPPQWSLFFFLTVFKAMNFLLVSTLAMDPVFLYVVFSFSQWCLFF